MAIQSKPMSMARTSATKAFVGAVVVAGGSALSFSLYQLLINPLPHGWMLLAALTLFSFIFTIKVPGIPAKISVSETFVFASVLLFGTAAATVTVALDALIMSGWRHRREPLKVLFNATEPTLSIWLASCLFYSIGGGSIRDNPSDTAALLLPVALLSLTYFLLNSSLTAIAIGLQTGTPVGTIWRTHFLWLGLNYLGGASVALLLVQTSTSVNVATISIILPLLLITYLTFKSSMGRIEDANRHIAQVNQMYMSTIETLAMAIDAKDQTTHGHIRRVQSRAIALARTLGMDEPHLIRAIQAAALLHDIGKLGVPEHILNKPGRLTPAEFAQMKTHAAVGADILAATEFPYPVVPIVRHHHENWDGSGYPDGLAGVDIPIGARLLAVVDCFDALTSDRPYRQRMSRREALNILQQRRGSMYDPLIVDTFTDFVDDIVVCAEPEQLLAFHDNHSQVDRKTLSEHLDIKQGREWDHSQAVRRLAIDKAFRLAANWIARDLPRCVPDSIFILFRLDDETNSLIPTCACNEAQRMARKLTIHVPQRLSGWVAANKQTIVNSDPRLDSPELADALSLKHALCTPIASGTILFGVLALYRTADRPFSLRETDSVESLSRAISTMFAEHLPNSLEFTKTEN